jgi:hypothetical protein
MHLAHHNSSSRCDLWKRREQRAISLDFHLPEIDLLPLDSHQRLRWKFVWTTISALDHLLELQRYMPQPASARHDTLVRGIPT